MVSISTIYSNSRQANTNVSKDSVEYGLPRNIRSPDHPMPDLSFTGTPSILVAPSTPQKESGVNDANDTPETAIWDYSANSPVFDDSPPDSFLGLTDTNIDENSYQEGSMEGYEPEEDYSDFDMAPFATSTPKPKRRPGMLSGLDSITEVLTPRSPQDENFRMSDNSRIGNVFGTPSKAGKSRDMMLPEGLSESEDIGSSKGQRPWTPISLDLTATKQTVSSQNKVCLLNFVVRESTNMN